jgi:hypothetical protein
MSANTDEQNLSSVTQSAPWRQTGSTGTFFTSPKRSDLVFQVSQQLTAADSGDDVAPTFADLSDFTSDSEVGEDCEVVSPVGSALTCVYSIAMLLRMRAAVCHEADDPTAVRYSSQYFSELPAPASAPKQSKAHAATGPCEQSWWRAAPAEQEGSWRPPLPEPSAVSWVSQRNRNPEEDERVTRSFRSILNKLTVEKFESLFEQLATCGITQPHHVSILMHEVFEKATSQHHLIPMYADLCVKLEKDARIASVVQAAGELHDFRRLLLNECQSVFEQCFESSDCDSKDCSVGEETAFRRKQQVLGNMKLIGQLLVHGMLSSDLFVGCCEELLRERTENPEALEALVALMMVAGPQFDKDTWQHYRRLQNILSDMSLLTKDKRSPPRLRFLIRDVLDAREAGWPWSRNRNGSKTAGIGPSKLQDVAADAAQKASPEKKAQWTPEITGLKQDRQAATGMLQQTLATNAPWKSKKQSSPQAEPSNTAGATQTAKSVTVATSHQEVFQAIEFRRALNTIFNDLASDKNIPGAVQRIRLQNVPIDQQADQFVDILSRVVEERCGAVRRLQLAFVAGLAAAQSSAFERTECLAGVDLFFRNVYGGACNEVHRLPAIMKSEFMPTMLEVFPAADLNKAVPASMRK